MMQRLASGSARGSLTKIGLLILVVFTAAAVAGTAVLGDTLSFDELLLSILAVCALFAALLFGLVRRVLSLQSDLDRVTTTDPLTGFADNRAFIRYASDVLNAGRDGTVVRVVIRDLHGVESRHGQGVGNAAIASISEHIKNQLRAHDMVGRLGNYEFGVLLEETSETRAQHIGERLGKVIALRIGSDNAVERIAPEITLVPAQEFFADHLVSAPVVNRGSEEAANAAGEPVVNPDEVLLTVARSA